VIVAQFWDVTRHEDGLPHENDIAEGLFAKDLPALSRAARSKQRHILDEFCANCRISQLMRRRSKVIETERGKRRQGRHEPEYDPELSGR
jgi:hypothetical protein